jgi:hypothetical protein
MLGLFLYTLVACDNSEVLPTNVDGRLADLEALAETQAAQIAALQAQVATLEEADAAARIATLETELGVGGDPAFVSRIDALDQGLVSLDARLTAFDADLDVRIEDATGQAVTRALSDVPASGGASYFQRIVDASAGVQSLTARADALEGAVFEEDLFGGIRLDDAGDPVSRLQDVLARLELLEGGGTTVSGVLQEVETRLEALETLGGMLESAVWETDADGAVVVVDGENVLRVDVLGDFVDTLDAALTGVESRVGLAEAALLSIDDELTTTDTLGAPLRVIAQLEAAVAQMVTDTELSDAVTAGDGALWDVLGRSPTLGQSVRQEIADLRLMEQNIDPAFLEQLGNYVSVGTDSFGRPRVLVSGANLQVRACDPADTAAVCDGRGNLLVGDNRTRGVSDAPLNRSGVHNVVIGDYNWYTGDGNLISGKSNLSATDHGVVIGTEFSILSAAATNGAVVGGSTGSVTAMNAAVIGGDHLSASVDGHTSLIAP